MGTGAPAVVAEWLEAADRRDGTRLELLSAEDVEVVGPRGSVRGARVLSEWVARAGFSAEPLRWFCGGDGTVVVEQDARWVDVATGAAQGRAVVASQFAVHGARVARYARHDALEPALAAAGLTAADEVLTRHG